MKLKNMLIFTLGILSVISFSLNITLMSILIILSSLGLFLVNSLNDLIQKKRQNVQSVISK